MRISPLGRTRGSRLAVAQGAFYLVTGLWPLLDIRSFQAVTGPKRDLWLVKTVGLLLGVIGGTLLDAGARGRVSRDLGRIGAGSAAALAVIDGVYVWRGTISRIFLADAAAELAFVAGWVASGTREGEE